MAKRSCRIFGTSYRMGDIEGCHRKFLESVPDVWVIVDRQERFAIAFAHSDCNGYVFIEWERHAIALGFTVGRIEIEKGVCPIVSRHASLPVFVLDERAGQAQVGG